MILIFYFILLVIMIRFDEASVLHEVQEASGLVSVVIYRDTVGFQTSFNVTITTRAYSEDPHTLSQDQSIATPNIGMTIIL